MRSLAGPRRRGHANKDGAHAPTRGARFWLVAATVAFLLTVLATTLLSLTRNTLKKNGRWLVSKALVETDLMGAQPYLEGTQALAHNRLNLGAWHGFQEVLFKKKLVPQEVSFRFLPSWNGYLVFIFNKGPDNFEGIRLSSDPDRESAYFTALGTGEFLEKRPLHLEDLECETWHHCCISFAENGLTVDLDGEQAAVDCGPLDEPKWLGFRNGWQTVYVDDVRIIERGGRPQHDECFDNRAQFWPAFRFALVRAVPISVLLLFALRLFTGTWRRSLVNFTAIGISAVAVALTLSVFVSYFLAERYPKVSRKLLRQEQQLIERCINTLDQARAGREFATKYTRTGPLDTRRVLFLGTSQTVGDGATVQSEAFVNVIERALNDHLRPAGRCECINGAVDGANAALLLECYQRDWVAYGQELCVINLCCNDSDREATPPDVFASLLRRFVEVNQAAGIKTLFVLEAVSTEVREGFRLHPVMARVARENNVPIVDADAYLDAHRDDGFLFWDLVHLTSFGHKLLAECLLPPIVEQLDIEPASP